MPYPLHAEVARVERAVGESTLQVDLPHGGEVVLLVQGLTPSGLVDEFLRLGGRDTFLPRFYVRRRDMQMLFTFSAEHSTVR